MSKDSENTQLILKEPNKSKNNSRLIQLQNIQKEAAELFEKKNQDYGDAFAQYGSIGVLIRMGDKIQRLKNISQTNIHLVESEKIRDTLIDLHNYSAMAIMLLDETDSKGIKNFYSKQNLDEDNDNVFQDSNKLKDDDEGCIIS